MNGVCTRVFARRTGQAAVASVHWPQPDGPAVRGKPGALLLELDPILPGRILCEGCPAERTCPPEPMSYPQIDRAVLEGRALGLRRFLLLSRNPGGYSGEALDLALKHPDCEFLLLGAAGVPDEGLQADLAGVDNLFLVVNATDLICAQAAHGVSGASRLTEQTLRQLQAEGVRYGFGCCCTRRDLSTVFSVKAVEQLSTLGAGFGMYYPYMPRSWNSPAPLAPSAEEWLAAGREIRALRDKVAIPLFDWGADFGFLDGPIDEGAPRGAALLHAVDSRMRHVTLGESLDLARSMPFLPAEAWEMDPQQRRICPVLADPQRLRRTVYANL